MEIYFEKSQLFLLGWFLIIAVSIYLFFKGRHIYKLVEGSMVGKITQIVIYSTLVNISSLGMLSTFYLKSNPQGFLVVLMVFIVWFIVFVWSLRTLGQVGKEAKKIIGKKIIQNQKIKK